MAAIVSLNTYLTYVGDSVTVSFTSPTHDILISDICVRVDGVGQVDGGVDYTLIIATNQVVFNVAPLNGTFIEIVRDTPIVNKLVDFFDGSINSEEDMDTAIDQLFFKLQELFDQSFLGTLNQFGIVGGSWDAQGRRIINVGDPIDPQDAATKAYVDSVATQGAQAVNLPGGDADVFKQKNGVTFEFRSLLEGTGISLTETADNIEIAIDTGPGGVVPAVRRIDTDEGIQGGGDLSVNRTHTLDVDGLTEDTDPDPAVDWLVSFDDSEGEHKKVQMNNPKVGGGLYILLQDQKATGVDGGTFAGGSWLTRDLNTIVDDTTGAVTLVLNEFTLPAGTYDVTVRAPCYAVDNAQARLFDVNNTLVLAVGHPIVINSGGEASLVNTVFKRITLAVATKLRVEHIALNGHVGNGFGDANIQSLGNSTEIAIYTEVIIRG